MTLEKLIDDAIKGEVNSDSLLVIAKTTFLVRIYHVRANIRIDLLPVNIAGYDKKDVVNAKRTG